ncbi:MAG: hypothetical protein HAW66_02960 [Shewanella sp.]|nr:hypothetical protein [Shewanella sp.]
MIVKPLSEVKLGLYASQSFAKEHGMPKGETDLNHFHWIMPTGFKRTIPIFKYLLSHVHDDNIVYQSNYFSDMAGAITEGLGIGVVATNLAEERQLIETPFQISGHSEYLWFVYHRDLRSSSKVAALYQCLKESF